MGIMVGLNEAACCSGIRPMGWTDEWREAVDDCAAGRAGSCACMMTAEVLTRRQTRHASGQAMMLS